MTARLHLKTLAPFAAEWWYAFPGIFNAIAPIVKTYQKAITKWFFIRFDDSGPHLRLRIKMGDSKQTFALMESLQKTLQTSIQAGIITDIQVKSYFPEIARYGKERLTQVEHFFYHDSLYALALFKRNYDTKTFYRIVLKTLQRLIVAGFPDTGKQFDFVRHVALAYSKEFAMNPGDFKLINRQSNIIKVDLQQINSFTMPSQIKKLENMFAKLMSQTHDVNDRYSLAADILHMHINRLFPIDQRAHEAIIYQQLFKFLKTQEFLTKQQVTEDVL